MKKFILVGLAAAGLLIFAACGDNDEAGSDTQYNEETTQAQDSTIIAATDYLPELTQMHNEIIGVSMLIPSAWQQNQLDTSSFRYSSEYDEGNFWDVKQMEISAFAIDEPLHSIMITQEMELAAHDFLEIELDGQRVYTWMGVEDFGFGFMDAIITVVFQAGNQLTVFEFRLSSEVLQEAMPLIDVMLESIRFD